ncbi:nose resistant to fluoxetine protein 6-like [Danaus plexippus]|uniref:nose resistant to fluoxetine protein 6-like n=1 Tax=Danaus plexippus TaxID=13037 RepID=UPI002AB2D7F5|nr:nose resistant to fluoxetine protein 6-like [Danaus plexippus]
MVCHRWTLALILFGLPILATVGAFRVRLPGSVSEVRPDLKKHKCENCDIGDLNFDRVDSVRKSEKIPYDNVKSILSEKRDLLSEKLKKISHKTIKTQDDLDETEQNKVMGKNEHDISVHLKKDKESKTKVKKPSIILDFSDDDDSDINEDDDDEDEDDIKQVVKEDYKKKVDIVPKFTPKVEKLVQLPKSKDKLIVINEKISDKKEPSKNEPTAQIQEESFKDINIKNVKTVAKDNKVSDDIEKKSKSKENDLSKRKIEIKIEEKDIDNNVKNTKKLSEDNTSIKHGDKKHLSSKTSQKKDELMNESAKEKKNEQASKKLSDLKESTHEESKKDKPLKVVDATKKDIADQSTSKDIRIISDALQRKNLLHSEFEDFYSFLPTFAPNFTRIHNPECRRHGQILLRQLRGSKLWALKMLDATAKFPSGFLQGNGIQLGDFDQCLGVRARVQLDTGSVVRLQGKYCLAMIDVKAEHPELEIPVHLAQGKNLFKSRIDDPGHFVPRFSTLSWGVCIPSACTSEDVEVVLRDAVKHYQYKTGISTRIRVDEHDCFTRKGSNWWKEWIELPTVITLSLYALVILIVLIATVQDMSARNDSNHEEHEEENKQMKKQETKTSSGGFLSCFSLYRTLNKLIAPASEDEIACIHGIRAVVTVALIVAHKFLPMALTPYTNRIRLSEILSSSLLSWCRAGWIFTDCFLLISGTLTSYRKSPSDNVAAKLLSRYIRLTPALLAIVLFYAYVWDNISSGPMWGTLVWKNSQLCRDGWWWNILYVQNYFGFEDMCAPQTHHMAMDFQLTIVGSIIVWMIQSEVPFAGSFLPTLHILSAYSRYTTVRDHRLTLLAYQGVSVSQLYRTGRLSYTSIYHRCSPYLIGLSLGLYLRNRSRLTKPLVYLGWFICGTLWGAIFWAGYDSGYLDYRYDVTYAAQYATLAPVAAALAFAWIIYAAQNGHSEILSRMLSGRPLLFISRISYALYLVQFVVYLTNTASIKASREFSLTSLIDLQEIVTILVSSIILTVTLVLPLQSLPKLFEAPTIDNLENNDNKDVSEYNNLQEKLESKYKTDEKELISESHQPRRSFLAHREVLEEIPEVEVEYEVQRDSHDGLEEILEEEDDEMMDREEDDLEIIEEEQGGEEDFWADREEYSSSYLRNGDQEVDEWEWTANGNDGTGSQHYRFNR